MNEWITITQHPEREQIVMAEIDVEDFNTEYTAGDRVGKIIDAIEFEQELRRRVADEV